MPNSSMRADARFWHSLSSGGMAFCFLGAAFFLGATLFCSSAACFRARSSARSFALTQSVTGSGPSGDCAGGGTAGEAGRAGCSCCCRFLGQRAAEFANDLPCLFVHCLNMQGLQVLLLLPEKPVLGLCKGHRQECWRCLQRTARLLPLCPAVLLVALEKGVDSDTDFATLRHLIPELLPHCQHALVVGWGKT